MIYILNLRFAINLYLILFILHTPFKVARRCFFSPLKAPIWSKLSPLEMALWSELSLLKMALWYKLSLFHVAIRFKLILFKVAIRFKVILFKMAFFTKPTLLMQQFHCRIEFCLYKFVGKFSIDLSFQILCKMLWMFKIVFDYFDQMGWWLRLIKWNIKLFLLNFRSHPFDLNNCRTTQSFTFHFKLFTQLSI